MFLRTGLSTLTILLALFPAQSLVAGPVSLDLIPSSQPVTAGQTVFFDAVISGIGGPGATEVGSFDIFYRFDPVLLMPLSVDFGVLLGDESFFEAITAYTLGSDFVEAAEVSFL